MSTIFDVLRLDHDSHKRLLECLAETSGDSLERRGLFRRLLKELREHTRAEERVLYARMLTDPSSQAQASHGIREHEELDDRLEELARADRSSPGWLQALRELQRRVVHHENEEERNAFSVAGRMLSDDEQESMADEFRSAKQVAAEG